MSNLTDNTTNLQAILDTVNALPEAGSGSSGGTSMETCTVSISCVERMVSPEPPIISHIYFSTCENGITVYKHKSVDSSGNYTIYNVVSGSIINVMFENLSGITCENASLIHATQDVNYQIRVIGIDAKAGETVTIMAR